MVVQPMLDDKVILHSDFTRFKNLIHETRYHGNRYCFVYKVLNICPNAFACCKCAKFEDVACKNQTENLWF